jgi:hypothetical protein
VQKERARDGERAGEGEGQGEREEGRGRELGKERKRERAYELGFEAPTLEELYAEDSVEERLPNFSLQASFDRALIQP